MVQIVPKQQKLVVSLGNVFPSHANITCGVPQRLILGALLFSLYTLPLGHIIRSFNISFQFYADDSQMYLSMNASDLTSVNILTACLADIKTLMSSIFLMLNNNKTEVMLFGPKTHRVSVTQTLASLGLQSTHDARNLGVIFDLDLSFSEKFSNITKTTISQIIAKIGFL